MGQASSPGSLSTGPAPICGQWGREKEGTLSWSWLWLPLFPPVRGPVFPPSSAGSPCALRGEETTWARSLCNQATVPRCCFSFMLLLPYSISARRTRLLGASRKTSLRNKADWGGLQGYLIFICLNPIPQSLELALPVGDSERMMGIQIAWDWI